MSDKEDISREADAMVSRVMKLLDHTARESDDLADMGLLLCLAIRGLVLLIQQGSSAQPGKYMGVNLETIGLRELTIKFLKICAAGKGKGL
jgi:hypothetical protein